MLKLSCKNNRTEDCMKLSTAVALRVSQILNQRNISQYRLQKDIAMSRNTMRTLMSERNSGVNNKLRDYV